MLPRVVILLGHLLVTSALVITPPRHLYSVDTRSRHEDLSNLTERLESLEERVEFITQNSLKNVDGRDDSSTDKFKHCAESIDSLDRRVKSNTENLQRQNTSLHDLAERVDTNRKNVHLQTTSLDNLKGHVESNSENTESQITSLDKLQERVDLDTESLQTLQTDHAAKAKSTRERLKALEETLLQLKSRVEEHHKAASNNTSPTRNLKCDVKVPSCPSNFIFNENPRLCFKVVHERISSQKEKNIRCSGLVEGGRLVQLKTSEELDVVRQYLTGSNDDYLIGGMLSRDTNTWIWMDGTHVDLSMFCPGEPTNAGDVLSMYGARGFCLDDVHDHNSGIKFICEMPL